MQVFIGGLFNFSAYQCDHLVLVPLPCSMKGASARLSLRFSLTMSLRTFTNTSPSRPIFQSNVENTGWPFSQNKHDMQGRNSNMEYHLELKINWRGLKNYMEESWNQRESHQFGQGLKRIFMDCLKDFNPGSKFMQKWRRWYDAGVQEIWFCRCWCAKIRFYRLPFTGAVHIGTLILTKVRRLEQLVWAGHRPLDKRVLPWYKAELLQQCRQQSTRFRLSSPFCVGIQRP